MCGYGAQEALPLRPAREGELYFPEDREVNLVELALATNIPKGCAETAVRGECGSFVEGGRGRGCQRSGAGLAAGWSTAGGGVRRGPSPAEPALLWFQFTSPTWTAEGTWRPKARVRRAVGSGPWLTLRPEELRVVPLHP